MIEAICGFITPSAIWFIVFNKPNQVGMSNYENCNLAFIASITPDAHEKGKLCSVPIKWPFFSVIIHVDG